MSYGSNSGGRAGSAGLEGWLIGGRYRIAERIGSGGMGTVWRAHDELVAREVAVKQPKISGDPEDPAFHRTAERLYREARAAARVEHSAAVAIHDVVVEDGLPWIVMELVRGEALDKVLRRGALPPAEAARIGLAVVDALAAAHSVGVIHRDVKPANVLLGQNGRVVLTDFGIAQIQGEESLTASGEFVGSIEFIAPERMSGRGAGAAADLWSLGVVLYAAVQGWSPFRRDTLESTLAAILAAEPPEPERAGPLGPLILRLLAKEPDLRANAEEASATLRAVAEGRPSPYGPEPLVATQHGWQLEEFGESGGKAGPTGGAGAPPAAVAPSHAHTTGPAPKRPYTTGRLLAIALVGVLAVGGAVWAGVTAGDDGASSVAEKTTGPSASGSASPRPGTWTAHREKQLDAIVSVPAGTAEYDRSDSGADYRNPSQWVAYGDKTVQIRLTRKEAVPTTIKEWAAEATLSWADDNAQTLSVPTSFHGYEAMATDTTYEVKGKKYRAMQLLITTSAQEHYELRVDMPKGGKDESRGHLLFTGARARLKVGKTMVSP
ncbi:serine/threonine-protein kinase [Streptomyces milbemycinicus]|uniref:serine/threonine-protein kinase n=1 Tax=Streptomyces milbemycinicus TaxID=476552 RepID=UPI003405531F